MQLPKPVRNILLFLVFLWIAQGPIVEIFVDWLWFESMGYLEVFQTKLTARLSLWVAGFAMEFQADDLVMAQDAYTRGCAMKSPRSCYGLGRSALRRGELARAAASFERACALEYQPGCVMLGAHHAVGAGTPKDNVLARRLLEPACDTALEGSPRESACALLEWLP